MKKIFSILAALVLANTIHVVQAQYTIRKNTPLHGREYAWKSVAHDTDPNAYDGFEQPGYDDNAWTKVTVPHNWDQYEGSRQLRHGNRHGTAWYRTEFTVRPEDKAGKRVFLFFEGVGSYGTVWVNGQKAGFHAGGRTTFTLDVTEWVKYGETNTLAVKAEHPAMIADLPWVCGGCSGEWGFSEGSQPMGIFRPVTLVVTGDVRVEPFGIHVWNDTSITEEKAGVHFNTEIKNYGSQEREIDVIVRILDKERKTQIEKRETILQQPGTTTVLEMLDTVRNPVFWTDKNPHLYYLAVDVYDSKNKIALDQEITPFGIRTVSWHLNRNDGSQTFQLNGKPILLNGVGEYEHNLGQSHAFGPEQIQARASQIRQAGFNAFRDAHQPHNLLYNQIWDETGMLWWSQMSAHIWYDTPAFRENFKQLLREFIKERRNSPSLIVWGLQNESMLPTDFAQECTEIFREMDPTTSSQRLVATCNGGTGTDWNVIQNWSGTYGGDPDNYAEEIKIQILNGEYGAWRSIDWHSEGDFDQKGPLTEDRMTLLMEMKIRQIESVRDSVAGQFFWIFSSHDNPGRIQNGEAWRDMDKIGPYNYKGVFTPWGEPLDAYYMYRSNYVSKEEAPMVYISSHTWPDRWTSPGRKNGIRVFSNCDSVALFNNLYGMDYLGTQTRQGIGTHFVWNNAPINTCVLTAAGMVSDTVQTYDHVVLNHLREPMLMNRLTSLSENVTQPDRSLRYLYRVNCGGDTFVDQNRSVWLADRHRTSDSTWGSRSWADDFPGIPPYFGSQRRTWDPVWNAEWPLFQTFRYGRDKLKFEFPVPDGQYTIELYFMEPWYGRDQSLNCAGWRVFDVAVNDQVVIRDLDLWNLRGANFAQRFVVEDVKITGGTLTVHFPHVTAGQAVISAIAIATKDRTVKAAQPSSTLFSLTSKHWRQNYWLDTGKEQFTDKLTTFAYIPSAFHGAEWLKGMQNMKNAVDNVFNQASNGGDRAFSCEFNDSARLYLLYERDIKLPKFLAEYEKSADSVVNGKNEVFDIYMKTMQKGEIVKLSASDAKRLVNLVATHIPNMGEEPSARPIDTLMIKDLKVTGTVESGRYRNEDFVKLNEKGGTIEFDVNPTLAATYLIRFRYMNHSNESIPMQMELINTLNGVPMVKETIWFEPTTVENKWRIMSTTTGSQINAGEYKVRLTVLDRPGIEFTRFEFE